MKTVLITLSLAWPVVMTLAVWQHASMPSPSWSDVVYATASRICHQRPERSFHTGGVAWPVCARCAGLYAAAPCGAVVAFGLRRRNGDDAARQGALVCAALPTLATLVLEWSGTGLVGNITRMLAALPLGAVIAFVLVDVAPGRQA